MRQLIKKFLCVVILASGLQAAWAYSLLGPTGNGGDAWQTDVIGYNLAYANSSIIPGGPVFLGDIGAPKNIGEGYRRNTPTIYYTYDANFLGFFGAVGATAADGAFAIMNNLTNVDSYSPSLSEFPLESQYPNYTAMTLYLTDLKSVTLHLLVEQMGLADPERFTWTLHDRVLPAGGVCPFDEEYLLVQRNFDIISTPLNQIQYSAYVNGVLYTYYIQEDCTGPNPLAYTVTFSTDPLAEQYTSVAANNFDGVLGLVGFGGAGGGGLQVGNFYTGLTRDDVAGLRYLLSTNNIDTEAAATNSIYLSATTNLNVNAQQLFPANTNGFFGGYGTFDLSVLLAFASTNDPTTLTALFPGLVVASTTTNFMIATGTNLVSYYTNQIGAPIGSPPLLVVKANTYQYPLVLYTYSFANVITNHYSPSTIVTIQTSYLTNLIGAPLGTPLVTNISTTYQNYKLPNGADLPSGDYYLLPTNLCGVDIASTFFSTNVTITNLITSANTNFNGTNLFYSQTAASSFKSYTYLIHPITCLEITNATGIYQGVKNVKFVRANYDSLISQYFQPITNYYTMVTVTNSQLRTRRFQRIVTQPDIVLTANDQGLPNTFNGTVTRNINFDTSNVLPGLAGPGVINAPTTFSYNKIGSAFYNTAALFLNTNGFIGSVNQTSAVPSLAWASFDGSTNAPILYPNGTSLANLQNVILIQITPPTLPNGAVGSPYPVTTFTATGGSFSPPFTWTLVSGYGGLPPGLTLSSAGTISGKPTKSGTYDFLLQLTDSLARTVQWNYSITIP